MSLEYHKCHHTCVSPKHITCPQSTTFFQSIIHGVPFPVLYCAVWRAVHSWAYTKRSRRYKTAQVLQGMATARSPQVRDKILKARYWNILKNGPCCSLKQNKLKKIINNQRAYVSYFVNSAEPNSSLRTSTCPKCRLQHPTLKHCLWDFPKIKSFWGTVPLYVTTVLTWAPPLAYN